MGTLLSFIQDANGVDASGQPWTGHIGVLLAGLAGSGKTEIAFATGNESGKPVIILDLGGMKSSLMGSSETAMRNALKMITATAAGGRVLFIMTANNSTVFSPEINRRFADQFFFDQPDRAGREMIWKVYQTKYGLTDKQVARPVGMDEGWTGAEIRRACERAQMFNKTVVEASKFIVPGNVSAREKIASMRATATGKFLSANYEGVYTGPPSEVPARSTGDARRVTL